jgi:hypothetical protein
VLGFQPLPAGYFVYLAIVVAAYLGIVELVKARVFQRDGTTAALTACSAPSSPG